jgi:hypothetical protein
MLFVQKLSEAVLWAIADPDPAFYLNADPDPGSQTYADPDRCLTVEFVKKSS